jgi:hypothetical protein
MVIIGRSNKSDGECGDGDAAVRHELLTVCPYDTVELKQEDLLILVAVCQSQVQSKIEFSAKQE